MVAEYALAPVEAAPLVGRSLADVEAEIEQGWTAAAAGYREIRDDRLYLQEGDKYEDFDTYCLDRWTVRRDAVDKMIQAFSVVEALHKNFMELAPPANEGQARALAPLLSKPEQMAAALEEARAEAKAKDAKLTAQRIGAAVKRRLAPEMEPEQEVEQPGGQDVTAMLVEVETAVEQPSPRERAFQSALEDLQRLSGELRDQCRVYDTHFYADDLENKEIVRLQRDIKALEAKVALIRSLGERIAERRIRRGGEPVPPGAAPLAVPFPADGAWNSDDAYAALVRLAETQPDVHADDLNAAYPAQAPRPNALGAVWLRAVTDGVLKWEGEMRPSKQPIKHGRAGRVYRSLVYRANP